MSWLWFIPALPLLGSAICGLLHFATLRARRSDPAANGPAPLAGMVAVGAMAGAFAVSLIGFGKLLGHDAHHRVLESAPWSWIDTGEFPIELAMVLDPLSSLMTLVVTGVGMLIHIYATGYMKGDPGFAKFFAYFNLFASAMLMLVLSSSLPGLFIGWEGVGLCSYLLIGFWYDKMPNSEAGQKAFVVNRIGDACFLIGMFLIVHALGTLDLPAGSGLLDMRTIVAAVASPEAQAVRGELVLAALMLFGGACGKSAQIPLFVWLPDAMAGPTPVSALIHAATMVTAGIYLVVRLNPLFALSPTLLLAIGTIAALTAFVAGTTALVQRDIKRVLAYSTVSQLGYMFLALGVGAWSAAIFHLATHAFFKALLFLGAGSVIHGMHEEQDMHKMGGLKRHMPRTFVTFMAGAAALSGLPLMSGYVSKDEILAHTFAGGGLYLILWIVGLVTAALTAFYTWRMVALTFFGKERFDPDKVHPHESPSVMTMPLMVLAVLSIFGGVLGLPPVLHVPHLLKEWLEPVTHTGTAMLTGGHEHHLSHTTEWILLGVGAVIALVFSHRGFHAYKDGLAADEALAERRPGAARLFGDAWGIDRAYYAYIVEPVRLVALGISVVVDQFIIDGLVNGAAALARSMGGRARKLASGNIASYGLWMGGVAVGIALLWVLGTLGGGTGQ